MCNASWGVGPRMSGGDRMYLEILKRINHRFNNLFFLSNADWFNLVQPLLEKAKPIFIPKIFDVLGIFPSYIMRTIYSIIVIIFIKKIDYIYSTSDFFPDVIPAFLKKKLTKKTVWVQSVFHLYPHWRNRKGSKFRALVGFYTQKLSLFLAKNADIVIVINSEMEVALLTRGFMRERVFIVHPGAPLEYIDSIPTNNTIKYDGVYLGRLAHTKGVLELIEIWRNVVNLKPDVRLGIIGGGDDVIINQMITKINNLDLQNNIDIIGFIDDEKAYAILKSSRVFVFPSFEEGFGIVVVEALASGCHVVLWDLAVFQEYFSSFARLAPRPSIPAFSDLVISALNETHRQDKNIEMFNWNKVADKFSNILWPLAK